MYSTVSIRIGISWCVQYCVNKDRDLLVCSTVSVSIKIYVVLLFILLSYCFLCFSTVSDVFLLFQNAEASSRSCSTVTQPGACIGLQTLHL